VFIGDSITDRVIEFVARYWSEPASRLTPSTCLEDDLGMTGDDASVFIRDFAAEFRVDLSGFEFDRHFGDERPATPWSLARGLAVWAATGRRGEAPSEPLTISRLAEAAAAGHWVDSNAPAT
jgi:hypothetical protein